MHKKDENQQHRKERLEAKNTDQSSSDHKDYKDSDKTKNLEEIGDPEIDDGSLPKVIKGKVFEEAIEAFNELAPQEKIEFFFRMERHSGPIPDPKTLGEYNQVLDKGAERIMKMAENSHLDTLNGRQSERRLAWTSLFISALLVLAVLLTGVYCVSKGAHGPAIAAFTYCVAQTVALFIARGRVSWPKKVEDGTENEGEKSK